MPTTQTLLIIDMRHAAERREKTLHSVSAKLAEATQALDAAQATPELRNKVLKTLQGAVAKPIQVVRVADMGSKTYLESEADVEGFVAQRKAELLATVRPGKMARVQ